MAMWGFSSLKDLLEVALVPIALAFLVPWVTQRWQNRQRDTQIKAELIAEISRLVMTTIMTVYVFKIPHKPQNGIGQNQGQELESVYKKWRIDSCVVGSKLHAYFPIKNGGELIHLKWRIFSDHLSEYYETSMDIDTNSEKNVCILEEQKEKLFEEKAKIIEEILISKITGFELRPQSQVP